MEMDFDEDLMLGAEAAVRFALEHDDETGAGIEDALPDDAQGGALERWAAGAPDDDEDDLLALAESIRRSLDMPHYE